MRSGAVAFTGLALAGAVLVGCGRLAFEPREPWRDQAEAACLASGLVTPSATVTPLTEIDGPGACGMTHPFRAAAFAGGAVELASAVTLACPVLSEIDSWIAETVQPAAELYFGQPVVGLKAGGYSCRSVNNLGGHASEHAFGNALDVFGFRLAGGRQVLVERGWSGTSDEQDFLREVFVGACRRFGTVLAPGSDRFHHDHLHLDLARHGPRAAHVCRPLIRFEPRLAPEAVTGSIRRR